MGLGLYPRFGRDLREQGHFPLERLLSPGCFQAPSLNTPRKGDLQLLWSGTSKSILRQGQWPLGIILASKESLWCLSWFLSSPCLQFSQAGSWYVLYARGCVLRLKSRCVNVNSVTSSTANSFHPVPCVSLGVLSVLLRKQLFIVSHHPPRNLFSQV